MEVSKNMDRIAKLGIFGCGLYGIARFALGSTYNWHNLFDTSVGNGGILHKLLHNAYHGRRQRLKRHLRSLEQFSDDIDIAQRLRDITTKHLQETKRILDRHHKQGDI